MGQRPAEASATIRMMAMPGKSDDPMQCRKRDGQPSSSLKTQQIGEEEAYANEKVTRFCCLLGCRSSAATTRTAAATTTIHKHHHWRHFHMQGSSGTGGGGGLPDRSRFREKSIGNSEASDSRNVSASSLKMWFFLVQTISTVAQILADCESPIIVVAFPLF
jgi:hypothetical protein